MRTCSEAFPDAPEGRFAGVDEVGRGSLAGPLVVAVVSVPEGVILQGVKDSKKMKPEEVRAFALRIKQRCEYQVDIVPAGDVDAYGVDACNSRAMAEVVGLLGDRVDMEGAVLDGRLKGVRTRCPCVASEGADSEFLEVACASVLAKHERDRIMGHLAVEHPGYGWERNVGYGTREHLDAIERLGLTPHHRRTFVPQRLLGPDK